MSGPTASNTQHPTSNTRLIGHADAAAWLRRAVATERLAHAYLITGPRGVGRRTFALEIAMATNCMAPDAAARPDYTCQQCRLIQRNVHPDIRLVRRAPEKRTILLRPPSPAGPQRDYTDNVEFIQSDAQLRPIMGRTKVYVILNAEELAQDAADRLGDQTSTRAAWGAGRSADLARRRAGACRDGCRALGWSPGLGDRCAAGHAPARSATDIHP